jgi:hypothetical protein
VDNYLIDIDQKTKREEQKQSAHPDKTAISQNVSEKEMLSVGQHIHENGRQE